ncbi:hypothetical protein ASPCAL09426 [Aspergillus calidoustus]|uniref:Glycine zipper 2TM domain-containing protein n=1 Tax=Aspergillus calidoustus TaxID=454130 RepID=A0A0U5CRQ4_ASPCI|nr:hypothetical protein ASPCAL09426 [Aspergillus calidoustus]
MTENIILPFPSSSALTPSVSSIFETSSTPQNIPDMSDPYYNQPHSYPSTTNGKHAESQYQPPAYGHGHLPHQQQGYPHAQPQYSEHSGHGHSQTQFQYHHQPAEPQDGHLSGQYEYTGSEDYKHDNTLLSPHYEPRSRDYRGSNAEYFEDSSRSHRTTARSTSHERRGREDEISGSGDEGERGIGGTLVGGATGYYLGHRKHHGLLGAIGGALLGNFIEKKVDERREDRHSAHHHGQHHGHYHPARHRSRSPHSHRSRSRYSHRSRSRDSHRSTDS